MNPNEFQIQIVGQSSRSFPANNFSFLKSGEDIICNFIFDDMSSDPATCITIALTISCIDQFLKKATEIDKIIQSREGTFIPWDDRKKIMREMPVFRVSVILPQMYNDIVHLSMGYLHPLSIDQTQKNKLNIIHVPSLAEVSMPNYHFIKYVESCKKALIK
ncbi:hypothetical protein FH593_08440 [Leptospira interrogans]|nr:MULTISPECIES: hypothetical protein [Leptospira]EKO07072.1 hypothetical protein LEP1GSC077_3992 [Leptospira interrogans str. C10069]ULG86075.1 hypothetical protein FH594_12080 [Leptospira interrogans]ULG90011.1 hypothetical protein FH593_08440 [Leptospira interrogans]UML76793.1 hypothetical protein FH583_04370 [Leptospira interrogans]